MLDIEVTSTLGLLELRSVGHFLHPHLTFGLQTAMATWRLNCAIGGTDVRVNVVIKEFDSTARLMVHIIEQAPLILAAYGVRGLEICHTATSSGWLMAGSEGYKSVREGRLPHQVRNNFIDPLDSLLNVKRTIKPLSFPLYGASPGDHAIHFIVWIGTRREHAKADARLEEFKKNLPRKPSPDCPPLPQVADLKSGRERFCDSDSSGSSYKQKETPTTKPELTSDTPPKSKQALAPTPDQTRPVNLWKKIRAKLSTRPAPSSHQRGFFKVIQRCFGGRNKIPRYKPSFLPTAELCDLIVRSFDNAILVA